MKLENGFLDDGMMEKIEKVKRKYNEEFSVMYEFNKISYKIIDSFKGIEATDENQYLLPAFVEVHKLYQSAVIMLERGLKNSFESILRNLMELWFQIAYVFKEPTNVLRLEKYTYYQALRKLDYIRNNNLFSVIPKKVVDKRYTELETLKRDLKDKGVKNPPNILDMCDELDLKQEYAYYSFLSDYTHSDFSNIFGLNIFTSRGILLNTNGIYSEFKNDSLRLLSIYECVLRKYVEVYVSDLKLEVDEIIKRAIQVYNKK